eukprot:3191724-Lingulodinium_polyedra.AAC.1
MHPRNADQRASWTDPARKRRRWTLPWTPSTRVRPRRARRLARSRPMLSSWHSPGRLRRLC